jgi:hypothetical protein
VSIVVLYDAKSSDDLAVYAAPELADYADQHGHQLRSHAVDVQDENKKTPAYLAAYVAAAKGKKLPMAMVGRAGKVRSSLEAPADCQAIIRLVEKTVGEAGEGRDFWAGGAWRRLGGLKPARPGAEQRWPCEGIEKNEPLIPADKWVDIELVAPWKVKDQDGYSSCCPTSFCSAYELAADRAGLRQFRLSALDLYARINGGRDQGATLEDALAEGVASGICTADYCPEQGWKKPAHKTGYELSRAKHRVLRATWCATWEQIASALQRHKAVQFGILVDGRFSPDPAGVIGPKRGHSGGGHAVVAIGMKRLDGQWYIIMLNSWGDRWGGSKDGQVRPGCCLLHVSWIEPMFGASAISSVVSPSDDPIASADRSPNVTGAHSRPVKGELFGESRSRLCLALAL